MKKVLLALVFLAGCGEAAESNVDSSEDHLELANASKWFRWLEDTHGEWAVKSSPSSADSSPWPDDTFGPSLSQIFAHNEIHIEGATPTQLFDLMVRPNEYRSFYPNSGTASTDKLTSVGQTYTWSTFGVSQSNTVMELLRNGNESRITWLAKSTGTQALHRWIFRAEGDGTTVITEECQNGFVAGLPAFISSMATSLPAAHELWLNGLRCKVLGSPDETMCTDTIKKNLASAPRP